MMPRFFNIVFVSALALLFAACEERASADEVRRMCARLEELRGDTSIPTDLEECERGALAEGVSRRQALCRISAVNTVEYWNRCRTGEAK